MNNKDIVLEYYKHNSLLSKSLKNRILSLYDLFLHLSSKGLKKNDIDKDLSQIILDEICLPNRKKEIALKLKTYLAPCLVHVVRKTMESSKVEVKKFENKRKETKYDCDYDYETIDVSNIDIPDKKLDLEFCKLIGVENPDE